MTLLGERVFYFMGMYLGGSVGKGCACDLGDSGDKGSVPGSGRSPGAGHGNSLQCSFLENPMDRGA